MAAQKSHVRTRGGALHPSVHRRGFIWLMLTGFVVYMVAAGFAGLGKTARIIGGAHVYILLYAMAAIAASYVCAALTYMALSEKSLKPMPTLLVQVSGGLANRLLPGGLGGLGINAWYLHRRGHSVGVSTAIVAANNTLGFLGNLLLVAISIALPGYRPRLHISVPSRTAVITAAIILIVIATTLFSPYVRRRIRGEALSIRRYLRVVVRRPLRGILALVSSLTLTGLHVIALQLTAYALHMAIGWKVGLYAISAGAFAGAVVPTPGGLGGAEAGIASMLAASGIAADDAISIALLYRFMTYWLPLLPGYVALRMVERRYL